MCRRLAPYIFYGAVFKHVPDGNPVYQKRYYEVSPAQREVNRPWVSRHGDKHHVLHITMNPMSSQALFINEKTKRTISITAFAIASDRSPCLRPVIYCCFLNVFSSTPMD